MDEAEIVAQTLSHSTQGELNEVKKVKQVGGNSKAAFAAISPALRPPGGEGRTQ